MTKSTPDATIERDAIAPRAATWRAAPAALAAIGLALGACETRLPDEGARDAVMARLASTPDRSGGLASSATAAARVDELRMRYRLPSSVRPGSLEPSTRDVLSGPVVSTYERSPGARGATHVRARPSAEHVRAVRTSALVDLPHRADDAAIVEDPRSHVRVRFSLEGATPAAATLANGYVVYMGAVRGADIVHRVHAEGTEDFIAFETRPAREELVYDVDVSEVAGLRLVSNTLELLDASGSPALRVAPPYVVDAAKSRHDAKLSVEGCAYDSNPAAPWGRPPTPIGASRCIVRVQWSNVTYPVLVDPAWSTTGSMVVNRNAHRAVALPSNRVLLIGGDPADTRFATTIPITAELFDETANGGAGAFAATGAPVKRHQNCTEEAPFTATVLPSGKVLVAGGGCTPFQAYSVGYPDAELYDPVIGKFVPTGAMTERRASHNAALLPSGKVLITGGYTSEYGTAPLLDVFDPDANGGVGAFLAAGTLSVGRAYHTSTPLADGRVLIAGGWYDGGGSVSSADVYDPLADGGVGAVVATIPMAPRASHAAVALPSGKVLLVGGWAEAAAEIFDPAANGGAGGFQPTGTMAERHFGQFAETVATLLPSGRVAVFGGVLHLPPDTAKPDLLTEVYDPALETFLCGPPIDAPRVDFQSTRLASGRLLVTGGLTGWRFSAFSTSTTLFEEPANVSPLPCPVPQYPVDAGVDASSPDAGVDAGPNTTEDAGPNTTEDAGPNTTEDAGPNTTDSGARANDVPPPSDTTTPAAPPSEGAPAPSDAAVDLTGRGSDGCSVAAVGAEERRPLGPAHALLVLLGLALVTVRARRGGTAASTHSPR